MKVEIVSTGTELLLGEIVNTNFQYLAGRLNALGFDVLYETTVGDNYGRMKDVLAHALERADIVITSGGLGPTQGDITKEVTADLLQKPLFMDKEILSDLEKFFAFRGICMPQNNAKQAMVPQDGIVLPNKCGTAPGILIEHDNKIIANLPGPPRELKDMFEKQLAPWLINKYGQQGVIYSYTLKSAGLGESTVAEKLADLISEQSNPTIALYARQGDIRIRITAKADDEETAKRLTSDLADKVRGRLDSIYGEGDDTLASVLGDTLRERQLTISIAESCTGGLVSNMLTDIAGSSGYFNGAAVTYSNQAKQDILGVNMADLSTYGAVSAEIAAQMAEGAARHFNSNLGIGITGIAGPGGGSEEKPVGTVYIAICFSGHTTTKRHTFSGQRADIKLRTASMAMLDAIKTIKG